MASEFQVKDSGVREEYESGMKRDTAEGKPRYDLTVPLLMEHPMLERWAIHMGKGAKKYGDRNWEKAMGVEEYKRFKQSAFRHFMQWFMGERDEDHAAAVFFNIQGAEYCSEKTHPAMTSEELEQAKKIKDKWRGMERSRT